MKKIIATAAAIAVSAISAFAFDVTLGARGNVNFGLGTTLSETSSRSLDSTRNAVKAANGTLNEGGNIGGGFGVYVNFGLVDLGPGSLGLQPEFDMNFNNGYNYVAKFTYSGTPVDGSYTIIDNTIDIPLLVTYKADIGSIFTLGGGVGPYLSIPVGLDQVAVYKNGSSSPTTTKVSDTMDMKADLNFGMAFDVNAGWKLGPGSIVLDCRYMLDFTPTKVSSKPKSGSTWSDPSEMCTRRGLSVGVGYQYKF